jgi:hypothetical protein
MKQLSGIKRPVGTTRWISSRFELQTAHWALGCADESSLLPHSKHGFGELRSRRRATDQHGQRKALHGVLQSRSE